MKKNYANLKGKFYNGNKVEVWSTVKGTQNILNCEMLGNILGCKSNGMDLSNFKIDIYNREVLHDIFESGNDFEFKKKIASTSKNF